MSVKLNTPVLLLTFNRPHTTKRVWLEITKARPKKLYIACDGPRENKHGDKEKCEEVKKITEKVNWECKVKRLYRDKNLGCRDAVSSAIDWFFKHEKEGIILEDDTLPNESFFDFASNMLDKYRNDKQVMHITGGNFLKGNIPIESSYYFSKYIHIWGWATWRRAWKKYDVGMKSWDNSLSFVGKYNIDLIESLYWKNLFNAVKEKKIDTWDYQWVYAVWKNQGLGIIPSKNMVRNIGFGSEATHTKNDETSEYEMYKLEKPYKHPKKKINEVADKYTRDNVYNINILNVLKQFIYYETQAKII